MDILVFVSKYSSKYILICIFFHRIKWTRQTIYPDMFEAIVRNKLIYDLSLNLQMNELSFVIIGLTVDDNDNVIYGPERSIRINSQASFGVNTFLSTYFDENYGLITFRDNRSVDRIVSALIVVDLNNGSYQEYSIPDIQIYPNGIEDNIIYLSHLDNATNNLIMHRWNRDTGRSEFTFWFPDNYGRVVKTFRGDAILATGQDNITRVITISDANIILETPIPARDCFLTEDSMFYTYNNALYYTDFNAQTTQIILQNNPNLVNADIPNLTPKIEFVDIMEGTIWAKYYFSVDDSYFFVKYALELNNRRNIMTKNARF